MRLLGSFWISDDEKVNFNELLKFGGYVSVDASVNPHNFPEDKNNDAFLLHLFCLNRKNKTEEAIAELNAKGYRPATLREVMLFASRYHDIAIREHIAALGSIKEIRGHKNKSTVSIVLNCGLYMHSIEDEWGNDTVFAAIKKRDCLEEVVEKTKKDEEFWTILANNEDILKTVVNYAKMLHFFKTINQEDWWGW